MRNLGVLSVVSISRYVRGRGLVVRVQVCAVTLQVRGVDAVIDSFKLFQFVEVALARVGER